MARKLLSPAGALLAWVVLAGSPARATVIDLGHPSMHSRNATNIGTDVTRAVVFDVIDSFGISSAGIRFNPSPLGASALAVDIYESRLETGPTHGPLLATASIDITRGGMRFYDVPILFSFLAGRRYDVGFRALDPGGWGYGLNSMAFYSFDQTAPPFVVGDVKVMDGACDGCGGYANTVMPHVRLETAPVPEPGTLALLGIGLGGAALFRRRPRP